jgi:hypothetical protein
MFQQIVEFIFGKKEINYPNDFAIITLSSPAIEHGLTDDRNKVILRYFYNKYNNLEMKKYRYSEERIHALQTIHKVPVFDKTKKEAILPIFSRILPGEVKFVQRR